MHLVRRNSNNIVTLNAATLESHCTADIFSLRSLAAARGGVAMSGGAAIKPAAGACRARLTSLALGLAATYLLFAALLPHRARRYRCYISRGTNLSANNAATVRKLMTRMP